MSRRGDFGSATLEAAIALPVFICVAVAFAFLLRCVHAHELVQHAITQAAAEIAETSYLYDVAGLLGYQRELEGLAGRARSRAEAAVANAFELDNWLPSGAAAAAIGDEAGAAFDAVQASVNGAAFGAFASRATQKYLSEAGEGTPAGAIAGEHGGDAFAGMADAALRGLSVSGGLAGLDFSESTYLNACDDVVIRVRYSLEAPIFLRAISVFEVRQQARARAWLFGERRVAAEGEAEDGGGAEEEEEEEGEGDTIWSLGNFERGRIIRELFGGNLPSSFPVISGYSNGEALLIKSLDATAASYQSAAALKRAIDGYVRDLAGYGGQERPWGQDAITVPPEGITSRRLVLVIPTNELADGLEAAIASCVGAARAQGVELQVERYERKIAKA